MTSYIVLSSSREKRQDYIEEFRLNHEIDQYDLTLIDKESSKNQQSIGIEDVKNLEKITFLKPIKSKIKAVILDDAHLLTIEAQNALLKTLEEPPEQTLILLSAETIEPLLPTILSRCRIIKIQPPRLDSFEPNEKEEFEKFIRELQDMRIGDKLKKAEELAKDKDGAIKWIEKLILILRIKLLLESPDTLDTVNTLRSLQSLHTLLKTTNVNPRFAIESTLLNL
jgi:DNA polymerase III delta prime subunit